LIIGIITASALFFFWHHRANAVLWPLETHGVAVIGLGWAWLTGFVIRRYDNRVFGIIAVIVAGGLVRYDSPTSFLLGGPVVSIVVAYLAFRPKIQIGEKVRKVLNWLGDASYPLYMIHQTVL